MKPPVQNRERSLVLIKPDGVQRGLVGEIITRFEKCGLKIVGMKLVYPSEKLAGEHYAENEEWLISVGTKTKKSYEKKGIKLDKTELEIGKEIRTQLLSYLTLSPIVALCLEGHNAIKHIRKIIGHTSPGEAAPGTIRGDLSFDTFQLADGANRPIQNLIHASGEVHEAKREVALWFSKEEIHDWKRIDEALLYRVVS